MPSALVLWTIGYVVGIVAGDAFGLSAQMAQELLCLSLPTWGWVGDWLARYRGSWHMGLSVLALLLGMWAQARPPLAYPILSLVQSDGSLVQAAVPTLGALSGSPALAATLGFGRPRATANPSDDRWLCQGVVQGLVEPTLRGATLRLAVTRLRPLLVSASSSQVPPPWLAVDPPLQMAVTVDGEPPELLPGDSVRMLATLRAAGGHRNPGLLPARTASTHGVAWTRADALLRIAEPTGPADFWTRDRSPALWMWRGAAKLRARLRAASDRTIAALPSWASGPPDRSQRAAAVLAALTLGDRAPLRRFDDGHDGTVESALRDAGVYHILSVSGLHLAVVCLGFFHGLAWLLRQVQASLARWGLATGWVTRRMAALGTLPLCAAYALVSGAEPPTVRAAIATGMALAACVLGMRVRPPEAIALALLCGTLPIAGDAAPRALFDPSLILSYAATLGLASLRPRTVATDGLSRSAQRARPHAGRDRAVFRLLRVLRGAGSTLASALGRVVRASLAAWLWTLPLVAYFFAEVQAAAVIGNLLVTPVAELCVVPVGLVTALLAVVCPPLAWASAALAVQAVDLMLWLAGVIASWRLCGPLAAPCLLVVALWYAGLSAGLRHRLWGTLLLLISAALHVALWCVPSDRLRVTFLDVGQGDAVVIELPRGGVIVVDAGMGPTLAQTRGWGPVGSAPADLGRTVLLPFLHHRGHRRIDLLIASHRHPDHIGGMATLLRQMDVDVLWLTRQPPTQSQGRDAPALVAAEQGLIDLAHRRGTLVSVPHTRSLQGVLLTVLGPRAVLQPGMMVADAGRDRAAARPGWPENDNSLVLRLQYAGRTVLLTGDIEGRAERALLRQYPPAALAADVMKVAHHGSRTSSSDAWLDGVRPRWAICSLGLHNRFGFPHATVLGRYAERQIPFLRTDLLGAVAVTIDRAGGLRVSTQAKALPWAAWLPDR